MCEITNYDDGLMMVGFPSVLCSAIKYIIICILRPAGTLHRIIFRYIQIYGLKYYYFKYSYLH